MPRPRTQKNPRPRTALPRTDPLETKGRNDPRPRNRDTGASVLHEKKVFKNFFQAISKKKREGLKNIFQAISKGEKQKKSLQIFRKVSSVFQQNFKGSKTSAVLEPKTRQFSRTWGFEAKAKDFKMCPRGRPRSQGRPRGTPPLVNKRTEILAIAASHTTHLCY